MAKWSRYNILVGDGQSDYLLFSTRTGALLRIDRDCRSQLGGSIDTSSDYFRLLMDLGFLVEDAADEVALISGVYEQARMSRARFSATVELTQACMFRCAYCYQSHTAQHMDDETADQVGLYLAKQLEGFEHLHVNWFGGEPLLRLGTLARLAKRLTAAAAEGKRSISQYIATNGYLLTPDVADALRQGGIGTVQITLDGDRESHDQLRTLRSGEGTYTRVLAGCRHVVDAGMGLLVRVNLNRNNCGHVDGLLADLSENGITPRNAVIHVTRAVDHGNCPPEVAAAMFTVPEFAAEWIKVLRLVAARGFALPQLDPIAYNCPFDLRQTVMLGADGSIRHCSSSSRPIGHVTQDGEERSCPGELPHLKDRDPLGDAECATCVYLPMCMGGCSHLAELGQEKCMPERYVLPELLDLAAGDGRMVEHQTGGGPNGRRQDGASA